MSTTPRIPVALPGQLGFFDSEGMTIIKPEERLTLRSLQVLRWFSGEDRYPREWRGKLVRTEQTFRSMDLVRRAYLLATPVGKPLFIYVRWINDPAPREQTSEEELAS